MSKKLAIFGSSGMARSVADIANDLDFNEIVFVDRDEGIEQIYGLPIISESKIKFLQNDGFVFSIGIGDNATRYKIAENFPFLEFINLIHPSATFGRFSKRNLELTKGNIIMAGARLSNNISFSNFGIFNFNCVIGHDVVLKDYINISPCAFMAGNVEIGNFVNVYGGAQIRNGAGMNSRLKIGDNAVIGMGATVLGSVDHNAHVPPGRAYMGRNR